MNIINSVFFNLISENEETFSVNICIFFVLVEFINRILVKGCNVDKFHFNGILKLIDAYVVDLDKAKDIP